jgi:hypothetical protein
MKKFGREAQNEGHEGTCLVLSILYIDFTPTLTSSVSYYILPSLAVLSTFQVSIVVSIELPYILTVYSSSNRF